MALSLRAYAPADEQSWLRCRALSFLETQYYDDVKTAKPRFDDAAVEFVAVADDGTVVGVLDVEVDGDLATIDTLAVHPDHARGGVASALLERALPLVRQAGATTLDAWTREDEAACAWYERWGFTEEYRYVHAYKLHDEPGDGFAVPGGPADAPGETLVTAHWHAGIEEEAELRARFRRVHVCRRYVRAL